MTQIEYTKQFFIGIDNGLYGGIVILNDFGYIEQRYVMPVIGSAKKEYDLQYIADIFKSIYDTSIYHVSLEKSQPFYKDGAKQAFKTGYGYGCMQGVLNALRISYEIVAPKEWQKKIFKGMNTNDSKTNSALFCQRKWPEYNWRVSEKSKQIHYGLCDAACIAYYGLIHND